MQCGYKFKTESRMQTHVIRSHGAEDHQLVHECTNCNKKFFNQTTYKKHIQLHAKKEETERRKASRKSSDEKNTVVLRQFFDMSCELCPTEFSSFPDAKKHYRSAHKQAGFLKCCNKIFTKQFRALQHCTNHLNPQKIP